MPQITSRQPGESYNRVCPRCHSLRGIEDFRWMGGSQQRRHPWCTTCERTANAERRAARRASGAQAPRVARRYAARLIGRERRFGVEIEFIGADRYAVAHELQARGLQAAVSGYTHSTVSNWKVTTDASCGSELVSPVLQGEAGREQVRRAMEGLRAAGARINRNCGIHVHHDMSGIGLPVMQRLAAIWSDVEERLFEIVAPSRRHNVYTKRFAGSEELRRVMRATDLREIGRYFDRYRTLNFAAYVRHGTVEVRMHQASLNATKVIEWILLGQAILEAAASGATVANGSVAEMVDSLQGLEARDRRFFVGRAATIAYAARSR